MNNYTTSDDDTNDDSEVMIWDLLPAQEQLVLDHNYLVAFIAGLGCVHPDTKIWTEHGLMRISEITKPVRVLSWNERDQRFQLSLSGGSFPKGRANLYRVSTDRGEFVATAHHRSFSSDHKYQPVKSMTKGSLLSACSQSLLHSISESGLLSLPSGEQHLNQTTVNWMGRCADVARRRGQRLLDQSDNDPTSSPVRDDVHTSVRKYAHSSYEHSDDLEERILGRNRHDRLTYQSCMRDFVPHSVELVEAEEHCISASLLERILPNLPPERLFRVRSEHHHKALESSALSHNLDHVAYCPPLDEAKTLKVSALEVNTFYDMQVLDTHNYVDEYGHIHHNSGKTRGAIYKALELGYTNQGLTGVYVMPNYSLVESTAVVTFKEVLEELQIPYTYNQKKYELVIDNVFKVLFRSAEETEKIVGFNAAWAIIDEPGLMDENILKKVQGRVRNPRSTRRQIVLVGTPEGLNWFYDFSKRKDVHVIKAKTTDNIHLPADYVDQLRASYTDEEIEAYINGEFVRFRGGWFKSKPRKLNPVEQFNGMEIFRLPSQGSGQYVIGVDTGGGLMRDSSAVVLVDKRDRTLMASWCSDSAPIDEIAERVEFLYHKFSTYLDVSSKTSQQTNPVVLIETNGIGEGCYQAIAVRKRIPAVRWKTTESSRYEGMLLVKRAVESGVIEGPERLQKETDDLLVENGRFKGPKDMSMSIGFCLKYTVEYPYIKPAERRAEVFEMKFGNNKRR